LSERTVAWYWTAPLPSPAQLELRWALERHGSLYLRYAVR